MKSKRKWERCLIKMIQPGVDGTQVSGDRIRRGIDTASDGLGAYIFKSVLACKHQRELVALRLWGAAYLAKVTRKAMMVRRANSCLWTFVTEPIFGGLLSSPLASC